MGKSILMLSMCILLCFSCNKVVGFQPSNDEETQMELIKDDDIIVDNITNEDGDFVDYDAWKWTVIIKLKPQADASYVVTEDPEFIALALKHAVVFRKTVSSSISSFDYSLYYTLNSMKMENKEEAVKEFLATGKFEDEIIYDSTERRNWAVKIKLKPHADKSYLVTEDPEIIALVLKYNVSISRSWWLPTTNPELLLYYDLRIKDSTSKEDRENIIKDFLLTGKFEDEVYEYGIGSPLVDWAVRLKLKHQAYAGYLATEEPEIKILVSRHVVELRQTYPGPKSNPDLLLYYTLIGISCISKESKENIIKDFLSTGKFEDDVYEYENVYPLS